MDYEELSKLIKEAYRRGYNDRDKEQSFDLGHALDLIYNPLERDEEDQKRQMVFEDLIEAIENHHLCCYESSREAMLEVLEKEKNASRALPPSTEGS